MNILFFPRQTSGVAEEDGDIMGSNSVLLFVQTQPSAGIYVSPLACWSLIHRCIFFSSFQLCSSKREQIVAHLLWSTAVTAEWCARMPLLLSVKAGQGAGSSSSALNLQQTCRLVGGRHRKNRARGHSLHGLLKLAVHSKALNPNLQAPCRSASRRVADPRPCPMCSSSCPVLSFPALSSPPGLFGLRQLLGKKRLNRRQCSRARGRRVTKKAY